MNASKIKAMQEFYFPVGAPPTVFPFAVTLAVDDADMNIKEAAGSLERISPEEPVHALLFSLKEAIETKVSDDVLRSYRQLLLTIPTEFVKVPKGEERYWKALNMREDIIERCRILTRSMRQRVYEVAGFKMDQEKIQNKTLSSLQIATMYEKHMKYSKKTEKVSKAFVDTALTIYSRVFSIAECRELLERADNVFDPASHPLQSIYSLQALVDRAKTAANIVWSLEGLIDGFSMSYLSLSNFVVTKLKDPRESAIEVLMLKKQVKEVILNASWLTPMALKPEIVAKALAVFASFDSVRLTWQNYPAENGEDSTCDTTYMAGWPQSATLLFEFLDDVIYGKEFVGRYKDAIKNRSTPEDFLAYPSVVVRIEAIAEAIRSEQPATASSGATGAGNATTAAAGGAGEAQSGTSTATTPGTAAAATTDTVEGAFSAMSHDDQTSWDRYMKKTIRTNVRLISQDTKTTQVFIDAIRACPLSMLRGDPTGLVLYHYDIAKAGEAQTRPDLRTCPLRDAVYQKLIRTVLEARQDPAESASSAAGPSPATLGVGEVGVIVDGGRRGNAARLLVPWKEGTTKEKNKKKDAGDDEDGENAADDDDDEADIGDDKPGFVPSLLQLAFTESSLAARRKFVRGTASIHQIQWAHIVSHKRICLPERPRRHFTGTNSGDLTRR